MTDRSLADRAARAAQWRFAGTLIGAVSRFLIGILLARLLTPADFGLTAIAFVVIGFAQPLGDFGIGSAVVQRQDLTDRHVRAAFTFSVIVGLSVATALVAVAPLAALFMHDARVTPVLRVLAIGFAVQGTAVVAGALLRRRLDFRQLFFIETGGYLVGYGAVAVSLALLGYGVWSLVWGGLAQSVLTSVAEVIASSHPVRPLFAGREVRDLLRFGIGAGLSSWINYVALNVDNFIVGRVLGTASLGLYSRAYNLMNLPYAYAASVMSGVLFPAFARMQDDTPRLRRAYLVATQLTALVAAGAMGTMAIVAPHLVRTLYGPRWIGVVPPLQVLCAVGYFRALYNIGGVVAQSAGRVYGELRRQIMYAVLVVLGAAVGTRYGLAGVAAGVAMAIVAMFVATAHLALQTTRTSWREYALAQRDALLTGGVTCAAALAARSILEWLAAPSALVMMGTLAAAGVPWCLGALWQLGDPELTVIRARLPSAWLKTAELMRFRASTFVKF